MLGAMSLTHCILSMALQLHEQIGQQFSCAPGRITRRSNKAHGNYPRSYLLHRLAVAVSGRAAEEVALVEITSGLGLTSSCIFFKDKNK
jgi:hypothetical protein